MIIDNASEVFVDGDNFAHPISCLENDPLYAVLRVGVARPVAPRVVVGLLALSPDEALLLLGTRPDRLHALSEKKTDNRQQGWADLIMSAKSGRMKEVHIFANLHLLWRARARVPALRKVQRRTIRKKGEKM